MTKIRVFDRQTGQILFECPLTDSEKAYQFAAQMEEIGLDIGIASPTLADTLSGSLGVSQEQIETYKKSMDEEIESHGGSCCFDDNCPNKKIN